MQPGGTDESQRSPAAHLWLWLGYALCMALAIPWYRQSGAMDPRWLGMPLWGWCAVAGALGMSLLTVVAVMRLWPDAPNGDEHTAGNSSGDEPNRDEPNRDKPNTGKPNTGKANTDKQADD